METGQCLFLDEGMYRSWRAIGKMEQLPADRDVAQFLVALYTKQKQKEGEECMTCCSHCHCPLTLYCTTCQRPSHLALPAHPPSSSQPFTSPALPSKSLAMLAASSVITDVHQTPPSITSDSHYTPLSVATDVHHSPLQQSQKPLCDVRDKENTTGLKAEGDIVDSDDSSLELDIVKTESLVGCHHHESKFNKSSVSSSSGDVRSQKNRRNKTKPASGQHKIKRKSTMCTNQRKATNGKLRDKSKIATNVLMKYDQDMKEIRQDTPSQCEVDIQNNGNSVGKRNCSSAASEITRKERRKRKPCASHDLEDGHVLSAEERNLAQIHEYDESYFERHRFEDDPLRRPGRRKKKTDNQTLAKHIPKKRKETQLKRRCNLASPTDHESSNTDEETSVCKKYYEETSHCSVTNHRQDRKDRLASLADSGNSVETLIKEESNQGLLGARTEKSQSVMDPEDSDRPPLRILVSAQKILPLKTTDGHYARFLYSYFECAHCQKAFKHKRAFNSHIQTHSGQNLSCTVCEKGSQCSCGDFKQEVKTTLQCEICGVHLKSLYALKFHIAAIHKNDRPFKCDLCEKSFVLKTKLRTHLKYKHAEGGRLFYCDQCSYRAFDARGLRVHQKCVHSQERPFKCSYCPSAFAIKFYLDVHLRKHTGEKPFRCSECSQAFAQRQSLTRHRRNYHGLEPTSNKTKTESQAS